MRMLCRRRGVRWVVCFALVLGSAATVTAVGSAAAARRGAGTVVIRPKWHLVGEVSSALADQRYVFMISPPTASDWYPSGGRLLDEQTGKSTYVARSGCRPALVGGPWLLFDCYPQTPRIALYRIATRRWTTLQAPSGVRSPWAVGADWIQYYLSQSPYQFLFQSIGTGQQRMLQAWHAGGPIVPNLDSPGLARRLCEPLRVPDAWDYTGEAEGPGDISFFGAFALVQGTTRPAPVGFTTFTYLERCGSRLHRSLSWAGRFETIGNANAIMTASGSTDYPDPYGIFLPSLQPFRVAVRGFLATTPFSDEYNSAESYQLLLTARRMYLMAPYPGPGCGDHPDSPCPPIPAQLWYAPAAKQSPKRYGIIYLTNPSVG